MKDCDPRERSHDDFAPADALRIVLVFEPQVARFGSSNFGEFTHKIEFETQGIESARARQQARILCEYRQRNARPINRNQQSIGQLTGCLISVLVELRRRSLAITISVDSVQLLKGRYLGHVNHAVQLYPVAADFNPREVVNGEVSERMGTRGCRAKYERSKQQNG